MKQSQAHFEKTARHAHAYGMTPERFAQQIQQDARAGEYLRFIRRQAEHKAMKKFFVLLFIFLCCVSYLIYLIVTH